MSLDAIIKVGGSLTRDIALKPLCRAISNLAKQHRLIIVPGGGEFADQVREAYHRFDLDETTAHHMALMAMDQVGRMLSSLIEGSFLSADLSAACTAAESGTISVFLPAALIRLADPLPHSWDVTSDTISAWIAVQTRCDRLVLLKDVDGLLHQPAAEGLPIEVLKELTIEALGCRRGGVDAFFPHFLAEKPLDVWVINGLYPERLIELLETDQTTGTRIRRR